MHRKIITAADMVVVSKSSKALSTYYNFYSQHSTSKTTEYVGKPVAGHRGKYLRIQRTDGGADTVAGNRCVRMHIDHNATGRKSI